jgi:hypothetical protein
MAFHTVSVLAAAAVAIVVFAVLVRFRGWRLSVALALVALVATLLAFRDRWPRPAGRVTKSTSTGISPDLAQLTTHIPDQELADGYVSSRACAECHDRQYDTWHASYHRTMTQRATPAAVIGDFADRHVELDGVAYSLSRQGDEFWVKISVPGSGHTAPQSIERPVVLTTGSHHLQIYWLPTGSGRTVAELPIFYLREDESWISRDASFLKPRDPHPGAPGVGRWNRECILCHTTHGRPRLRPDAGNMASDSLVAEFGIACEACHGPGEAHVRARRGERIEGAIVNPAELASQRSTEVCGRCHGITLPREQGGFADLYEYGYKFRPGDVLQDTLHIVRRDEATRQRLKSGALPDDEHVDRAFDLQFWRDGMVRVTGREFNGLSATACFQKGKMACVSCHVLHQPRDDARPVKEWAEDQLKMEALGDSACTQCHATDEYAAAHTHHAATSSGSRCYNCHMPHTTYGLLKAIRSHTIDSPDAAVSARVGRPNACNLCHLDQTLAWTAGHLEEWYSVPAPSLDDDQRNISATVLWALQGDAGQRALAAWHMGWEPAVKISGNYWQAPYLAVLLNDPYLAIRFIARRSLRKLPSFADFQYNFLGSAGEVDGAVQAALQIWRERRGTRSATEPAGGPAPPRIPESVLITPDGELKQDVFNRLKSRRNDTPVSMAE